MPKFRKGADANGNQRTSGTYYSKKHNIKKGNVVMEAFIAAGASITVGVLSLVGVVITNANSNRKIEQQRRHRLLQTAKLTSLPEKFGNIITSPAGCRWWKNRSEL